ncbi:hypothetical protein F8566_38505 [Actinomadura rudentiformis]|uniref:Cation/H+ exchanger transmembrane domain-containing protein n=1 Tax=Actinomadura rudentiformis TaxID=359158 RepID=A0A6H9YKZ3_9ACTN|nr:hypothetical protein F8566_38505 [Actinomadura rudentiformis]
MTGTGQETDKTGETGETGETEQETAAGAMPWLTPPGRRRLVTVSIVFAGIPAAVAATVLTTLGSDGREPGGGHQDFGVVAHFLLAAALVLLAAWTGGRLAVRLGQPPVMGEILAGIALGPSLLGALSPETMRWLFPDQVRPMLSALAQLGLVLFMFEVGRELAAVRLRGAAHSFVLVAVASMSVPFATGMAAAPLLSDGNTGPAGAPAAFALFLGCALSITAFPVLARILTDLRLTRTLPGRMSLFAAAGGDGVAWLMLAVALATAGGQSAGALALTALGAVAYCAVLLGTGRRVLLGLPALRRPGPAAGILLVAGVAVSAAITEALGLHALIGAFLFGIAWPPGHPVADAAAERTNSVARPVLLPFYFLLFGLTFDLGAAGLTWATAGLTGLLLVMAIATKFLGAALCARLTGVSGRDSVALGILVNTRGLTEIVVLMTGREAGIINDRLFTVLVVVTLITTLMTAPLLRVTGLHPGSAAGELPGGRAGPAFERVGERRGAGEPDLTGHLERRDPLEQQLLGERPPGVGDDGAE